MPFQNTIPSPAPSLLDAFRRRCVEAGERPAVVHEDQLTSYRELDAMAWRIANFLSASGVVGGERIGLCLDRSVTAIAGMIGVMRAGAAFVPLDPEYPIDRLRYMIDDAQISIVFCEPKYHDYFTRDRSNGGPAFIDPDCGHVTAMASLPEGRLMKSMIAENDLAYVMYTSGSTGKPKGVEIQHRALNTYCDADIEVYKLTETDRTLHFSTLNFDIAIEEIFPPLASGGAVVVRPGTRSDAENELGAIIRAHNVTALHLATAYWHEWVDLMTAADERVPSSLRMVLATGEKVSPAHYQRWLAMCDHDLLWCNAYGPTETCVTATVFIPPTGWNGESMPIGKPLKHYSAHILDSNDQPLGVGETGDLYIGGPALARGYLNLPDRTSEVFRTVDLRDGIGPVRLYKTGDLARWLPSGDVEFAGRIDHQIKLGSYRIEPGEIEYQLANHESVLESLVTYDEVDGKKTLIAYLAVGDRKVRAIDVARFLKDRLPPYMIPARYVFCTSFPKTVNGKMDRGSLPRPDTGELARDGEVDQPRNELEKMLVDLWNECLGVTRVGIHDDFFAIGGSSLLVTRVIAGIRRHYQLAIPVRDFFANPTVASIAKLLAERLELPPVTTYKATSCRELRDRLPAIDAFYFKHDQESLFAVRYPGMRSDSDQGLPNQGLPNEKHRGGVLICPADGHEYTRSHRNLQQLALRLASAGVDVMRFDFSGCGNSSGDNRDGRIERWQEQIHTAADTFWQRASLDRLTILGVRLGATLVMQRIPEMVTRLVMWDPIVDGERYLKMLDHFHHRSMNDVTHYPVRRKSSIPQTFGVEMSVEKRAGYRNLRLPASTVFYNSLDTRLLLSRNYRCDEGLDNTLIERLPTDAVVETDDEIYWHQWRYVHSAFASPQTLQSVIEWETLETCCK